MSDYYLKMIQSIIAFEGDAASTAIFSAGMNAAQRSGFYTATHNALSVMVSPVGTGKTMEIGVIAFAWVLAGKKFVIFTQTNQAVREALEKVKEVMQKRLHAPRSSLERLYGIAMAFQEIMLR